MGWRKFIKLNLLNWRELLKTAFLYHNIDVVITTTSLIFFILFLTRVNPMVSWDYHVSILE
jgi:hypothetical protein